MYLFFLVWKGIGTKFVLDGGALFHRVLWKKGETFEQIFIKYSSYLSINYPEATVVFDGYEEPQKTQHTLEEYGL
jgi:hypothetical protein